jgi:hypothetical protein
VIDKIDRQLQDWVATVLDSTAVSFGPPTEDPSEPRVSLYLYEISEMPPARGEDRPPLQAALHYLITVLAEDPLASHRMLGELLFGAMEERGFEVQLGVATGDLWSTFGTRRRPSFVLKVPLRLERKEPLAKPVTQPVELSQSTIGPLWGRLVAPVGDAEVPLTNAVVELPSYHLSTRTGRKGEFYFRTVPFTPKEKLLRVKARRRRLEVRTTQGMHESEPLVIHFPVLET